jgi:hypothetical protein
LTYIFLSTQFYRTDDTPAFVAVWASPGSYGSDSDNYSIQGQRYNSAGTPQGVQFQVNSYTSGSQDSPTVAMDIDGDFAVVWHSYGSSGSDTSDSSIQGKRYNSSGTAQGGEFQVNSYTTDAQHYPAIGMDADGDFLVAWQSDGSVADDTSSYSIQAQWFSSDGTADGSQIQVNTYTSQTQNFPEVSMDADGDAVVIWASRGSGGSDSDSLSIQGQLYLNGGTSAGAQFQINTYTTSVQTRPAVVMNGASQFVVSWASDGSGGSDSDGNSVQARLLSYEGSPKIYLPIVVRP